MNPNKILKKIAPNNRKAAKALGIPYPTIQRYAGSAGVKSAPAKVLFAVLEIVAERQGTDRLLEILAEAREVVKKDI